MRLVLGAEVPAGAAHAARHSLPGLLKILDALPPERRPQMIRGDCGFGSEPFIAPLEERGQLSARAVALICNWWSLFVRLADPEARREAITSRPYIKLLLALPGPPNPPRLSAFPAQGAA